VKLGHRGPSRSCSPRSILVDEHNPCPPGSRSRPPTLDLSRRAVASWFRGDRGRGTRTVTMSQSILGASNTCPLISAMSGRSNHTARSTRLQRVETHNNQSHPAHRSRLGVEDGRSISRLADSRASRCALASTIPDRALARFFLGKILDLVAHVRDARSNGSHSVA